MLGQLHRVVQQLFDFFIPPTQQEERVRSYSLVDVPVSPQTHSEHATSITTLWKYDEPKVRDTIWALKYRRSAAAATLCAQALEEYLADVVSEASLMQETRPCVLIPIPLSKERQRERGYNQITLVLRALTRQMPGITLDTHALIKQRHTPPQTSLKRTARLKNMQGAFKLSPEAAQLKHARVYIVDDVTTTGTTLTQAARTLKKAGIKCECIALARTGW